MAPTGMPHALELLDITVTFRAKDNPGQRYTAVGGTTLRIAAGSWAGDGQALNLSFARRAKSLV